jgi:hypothetical protein
MGLAMTNPTNPVRLRISPMTPATMTKMPRNLLKAPILSPDDKNINQKIFGGPEFKQIDYSDPTRFL